MKPTTTHHTKYSEYEQCDCENELSENWWWVMKVAWARKIDAVQRANAGPTQNCTHLYIYIHIQIYCRCATNRHISFGESREMHRVQW